MLEELWDSISAEQESFRLTGEQRDELDRRVADYHSSPGDGCSWETYENSYEKHEDPMLWELHEIRHELHQEIRLKSVAEINREAVGKFMRWQRRHGLDSLADDLDQMPNEAVRGCQA